MFGLIRPCRGRLGATAHELWSAHLCGLCLALRDNAGQPARLATTTDGVVLSLLAAAQRSPGPARRAAGPCPLRSLHRAQVVAPEDPGIILATAASLAAAAARVLVPSADAALLRTVLVDELAHAVARAFAGAAGAPAGRGGWWARRHARRRQRRRARRHGRRRDRTDCCSESGEACDCGCDCG